MKKDEIKIFENEELGLQVRTFLNEDGSISVSAEDTAIGFGWVQEKKGKIYPRWETLNGYCNDLGFSQQVGKDDYIPESLFYMLGFKAGNERAQKYQQWLAMEVLPSLRKTGSYEMPKKQTKTESQRPSLPAVTSAAKFLTSLTEKAGCDNKIQLLTVKSFYETNGYPVMIEIEADQQYYDTVHIARQVGLYYQSSGKPADKAVNEIIRRLNVSESLYTETWESKGNWQGTVRKYAPEVIEMIKKWYADNDYPRDIEYEQVDGKKKCYHVMWRDMEVA